MDFLLIGYFRSGTTLVSNIINTNNKGHCVVDPFIYLIKIFRNKIYKMNKLKIKDRDQDIEEYLVYGEKSIQKFIKEEASLNYKITKKEKKEYLQKLIIHKSYQHSKIKNIKDIKGKYFNEVLDQSLKDFAQLAKNKDYSIIGTKISWIENYICVFLRNNPNLKIIAIVRDIRQIINSANFYDRHNFASPARPLLYHIAYWKNSILNINENIDKVHLVKYESFEKDFEKEKNNIYEYLNIKNKRKIKNLKDQYGKVWKNNSSFNFKIKHKQNIIYLNNQIRVPKNIIKIIEFFCYEELRIMGYKVKKPKIINNNFVIKELKKVEDPSNFAKKYKKWFNYEVILNKIYKL